MESFSLHVIVLIETEIKNSIGKYFVVSVHELPSSINSR